MIRILRSFTYKLALNLALLVTATTAAVLVLVGWILTVQGKHSLEVLHDGEFRELSQMLSVKPGMRAEEIGRRIGQDTDNDAGLYFTQIHDDKGKVLFRSANLGDLVLPISQGAGVHRSVTLPGVGLVRISSYSSAGFHYEIASTLSPLDHVLDVYIGVAALLLSCVAVASLVLGWAFARITLRPLRAIRKTAGRIGADNLSERIPLPAGSDELAALTLLLNQMFDRLEAAFQQSKRFTADASHEIKTPLALIRLNAERLRPAVEGDAVLSGHLDDMLEDIDRLHRIVESLLFLAKAESGVWSVPMTRQDTRGFIEALSEDAGVLAEDKSIHFEVTANEEGEAECEPTLIHQLLLNIISNAVSACPSHGKVALSSRISGKTWSLDITDEGPGLPDEQLERIFERFLRYEVPVSQSAAPSKRGHGLGLAIARSIAALHRGTIKAANRTDRSGLCLRVKMPIINRHEAK